MTDIQKANLLHQVLQHFDVSEDQLKKWLAQIQDESVRENFQRFRDGLKVEDNYRHFASALPWVKNINAIDQQQEPVHKKEYQAPDYTLFVENSSKEVFTLLVDVKSVKGNKEVLEITPKQKHALMNYARDSKAPLVLAIYWEKINYWTHNVIRQLTGKKANKLSWQEAMKNDVSHVLGDATFMIEKPFYRRTRFYAGPTKEGGQHKKYGHYSTIEVGLDLKAMKEYSVFESSVIDCMFRAREVECVREDNSELLVTEIFAETLMLPKITNWLVKLLQIWGIEPSEKPFDMKVTEMGRLCILNLMNDLGYTPFYAIPESKNAGTDELFRLAYHETSVWRSYENSK